MAKVADVRDNGGHGGNSCGLLDMEDEGAVGAAAAGGVGARLLTPTAMPACSKRACGGMWRMWVITDGTLRNCRLRTRNTFRLVISVVGTISLLDNYGGSGLCQR
jgi:hypothetical protein